MIYSLGVFEEEIVKKSLRHPPVPGGKDPVQVAGSDWTKEFQKEHVKCP